MPGAIQGVLADWVVDHLDDPITELTPAGDAGPPVIEEGGADDGDSNNNGDDDASP